jgi:hypothetical protein
MGILFFVSRLNRNLISFLHNPAPNDKSRFYIVKTAFCVFAANKFADYILKTDVDKGANVISKYCA